MCTIIGKSKVKTATGYKVAIKTNGKYYSPYTLIEYKIGKVEKPDLKGRFKKEIPGNIFVEKMNGNTAIIKRKKDVLSYFKKSGDVKYFQRKYGDINFALLKIKLTKILYEGDFTSYPTLIGSKILSIEEVK